MVMRERKPIHPGEILEESVLKPLDMDAQELATALAMSSKHVSEILRGRRSITADTALRLARWLGGGSSPRFWLNLQQAYDLEVAEEELGAEIAKVVKPREAA